MLCQEGLEEEAYTDEELKRKGKRNDISCLSTVVSQYVHPIQIYVLRLYKKKFLRHILISSQNVMKITTTKKNTF